MDVGEAGVGQMIPPAITASVSTWERRRGRNARARVAVEHRRRLDRLLASPAALALEEIVRLYNRRQEVSYEFVAQRGGGTDLARSLVVLEELAEVVPRVVPLDILLLVHDARREVLLVRLALEDCARIVSEVRSGAQGCENLLFSSTVPVATKR